MGTYSDSCECKLFKVLLAMLHAHAREGAGQDGYKDQKKYSHDIVHPGTCCVSCIHWFNILKK